MQLENVKISNNYEICTLAILNINYINNVLGQPKFSEADLARSLLFTISNDIGHIASLYATVYNVDKVYFGGYFLRNHPLSMHTISYSIKYWSHVSLHIYFVSVFYNVFLVDPIVCLNQVNLYN